MIRVMLVFHPGGSLHYCTTEPIAIQDRYIVSERDGPTMIVDVDESQVPPPGMVPEFALVRTK